MIIGCIIVRIFGTIKLRLFRTMKKSTFSLIFLFLSLFSAQQLVGQDQFEKTVFKALETGNTELIQSYFTSSIYLELPGSRGTQSKNQARLLLETFFKKNKPSEFKINASGKAVDSQSNYYIGELITKPTSFRVYLIGKPEQQQIHSISITEMP